MNHKNSSIHNFLQTSRGRSILFVGDSITLQMYSGIAMEMKAHSIHYKQVSVKPAFSQCHIFVPHYNVTLKLLYFYDLEDPHETKKTESGPGSPFFLSQATLSSQLQQTDIVMANIGLHHWPQPSYQARQMKRIQELVEQEQDKRAVTITNNLCLIWRRTLPQHFPTNKGTGHYGDRWKNWTKVSKQIGCQPLPNEWNHPSDGAMESVRNNSTKISKQPMLDFTTILHNASHYHSRRGSGGDCSHYCYSPLLWGPMLHLTAEVIRQAC